MIEPGSRGVAMSADALTAGIPACAGMTADASSTTNLPRRLRRLAPAVAGGLVGNARMMRAVGQAGQRLAAAKEEIRAGGIADRPMASGLIQFQQRYSLAHWNDIVVGDRIRFQLDFESMRQRGIAARSGTGDPHHVLGGPRLALARRR